MGRLQPLNGIAPQVLVDLAEMKEFIPVDALGYRQLDLEQDGHCNGDPQDGGPVPQPGARLFRLDRRCGAGRHRSGGVREFRRAYLGTYRRLWPRLQRVDPVLERVQAHEVRLEQLAV